MPVLKVALRRVCAAAIAVAASSTIASADPLGLAGPMRNPGAVFDNLVRDPNASFSMPAQLRRQIVEYSGSETAGTIVRAGANVTQFRVGDRVALHHHVPCLDCHMCRHRAFAQLGGNFR